MGLVVTAAVAIASLALGQTDASLPTDSRDWVSADGAHTTTATLVGFFTAGVELKKSDGKVIRVPLDKLSKADRDLAIGIFRRWDQRSTIGVTLAELATLKANAKKKDNYKTDEAFRKLVNSLPNTPCLWVGEALVDSPGASAGLKKADLITHINGRQVRDLNDVTEVFMGVPPGAECEIRFLRSSSGPKGIAWKPESAKCFAATTAQLRDAARAREAENKLLGPLRITAGGMSENSIGIPIVTVKVQNVTDSACVAFSVEVDCFDNFDDPVKSIRGSNTFGGISQDRIAPGKTDTSSWTLNLHDNTTRAVVRITRAKLENGTEWNVKDGKAQEFTVRLKK